MISTRIAWRYLFAKKSTQAINIISLVSMLAMFVGAFALVLILSVFNGFEDLVTKLYNSFYPDIEITATQGKTFLLDSKQIAALENDPSVLDYAKCLQENAYLQYGEKDYIAQLKGVDDNYAKVSGIVNTIHVGKYQLHDSTFQYGIVGALIFDALNINLENGITPLRVTVPRPGTATTLLPEDAFSVAELMPSAVFSIQQEFDSKYVFSSLGFVQNLLNVDSNTISAIEIKMKAGESEENVKQNLQKKLGKDFLVKTKYEQRQTIYRVIKMERWAVYAILTFILGVISFNIIGSISLLVIEKQRDISILKAMGASNSIIKNIFLKEGALMAIIGGCLGMFLAFVLCLLQLHFGFLKLSGGGGSFVVDAYPVKLKLADFILTFCTVLLIAVLAAYFPANKAGKSDLKFKE